MKSVRIHGHGGVEQLRIDELERPKPGPRQALVQIKAASLNHLDVWVRKGFPGLSLPKVLGSDAAGVVVELGPGATKYRPGDRVVTQPGYGCGLCEQCLGGRENYCLYYGIVGEHWPGVQSEYLALDEDLLAPAPPNISFEEAAAIPLVFVTAWEMLVNKCRVGATDTVLVVGASSGVGSAAVQIARLYGARVIATAGTAKLDKARELGADAVIDHYKQDIAKEVKRLTGGIGAQIVVDHVGTATWQSAMRSLAKGGKLAVCGSTTGFEVTVDLRFLYLRQQSLLGSTMGTRGDLLRILKLVEAGRLRPIVDRVFALAEVAKAHEYLEAGQQFGKVVLTF